MKLLIESLSKADKDITKGDKYLINMGTPKKPLVYVAEVISVGARTVTFRYNGTESRGKRVEIGKVSTKILTKTRRKNTHKPLSDVQAAKVLANIVSPNTVNSVKTNRTKATRTDSSEGLSKSELSKVMTEVLARKLKIDQVRPKQVSNMRYYVDGSGRILVVSYEDDDGVREVRLTNRMLKPIDVDIASSWLEAKGAQPYVNKTDDTETEETESSDEEIMFSWLSKVVKKSFGLIDKSILPSQKEYKALKYIGDRVKTGRTGDEAEATIVAIGRRTDNSKVSVLLVTLKGAVLSTIVPSVSELGIAKKLKGLERKVVGRRATYIAYKKLFDKMLSSVDENKDAHTTRVDNNTKTEKRFHIDKSSVGRTVKVKFSNGIFNKEIKKINTSQQRFAITSRTGDLRWLDYGQIVGFLPK